MIHYFFSILLAIGVYNTANAQTTYSKEVEDNIKEVEQNLGVQKFLIEGRPAASVEERMAYYHIKGLSVAVIYNYKIEWAKAYGWADSALQKRATTETLFQPGSISKSLNAVGVLKLVQDKKLDLDTDINAYLSSWKFPYDSVSRNKKITVANLLSHTAGLGVHGFPGYFKGDKFPTIPQILNGKKPANTSAVRSIFEPGLRFTYSGGGTMISQLIEMDITKQNYDTYMHHNVLQPMGMTQSFFTQPPPQNKEALLATGYSANGQEIKGKYPVLIEQAAGGLWTTPTDLCKFIIETQLSLKGKSNKVLSQEMTKLMLTPYIDESAAFGAFIENRNGELYFQHSAGNLGFSGQYYGSLENGNGVVIVANSDNSNGLVREFITSVANVYQWKGFYNGEKPITKKVLQIPDSVLKSYAGIYKQETAVTTIVYNNGHLLYYAGSAPWNMYFTSATEFFNLESGSEKTFLKNSEGKITGFSKKVNDKDVGTAVKIEPLDLPDTILKTYSGNYLDGQDRLKLIVKKHELWLDVGYGQPLMKLNFITSTTFYMLEDFGAEYTFVLNSDNTVNHIAAKAGENTKTITRTK